MTKDLIDSFGRKIEYLRVSVTDRCDLRCQYCMPEKHTDFAEPAHWLTFDEITRVIRVFTQLGVRRVRITGGEPLVRKNLPDLVQGLQALPGIKDLSLSTNAMQLKKFASALKQAGIDRLNVSLDTLDPDKFKRITKGLLHKVLEGLAAAKQAGFTPIKINMVVLAETTFDDIDAMTAYCSDNDFTLRLIETMPLGVTGQAAYYDTALTFAEIKRQLAKKFDLLPATMLGGGPARYLRVAGTQTRIGFITPISQHFCATCNRVRLTVDGTLHTCLGQDDHLALLPQLRSGATDTELIQTIQQAIQSKPERHEFNEKPLQLTRVMSATGG